MSTTACLSLIDILFSICYLGEEFMEGKALGSMPISEFWQKTLGMLSRAQDEIVKVSQIGKTQIDRSFLAHERHKLFQKLGELVYHLIKEEKVQLPELDRLVEHIDRLSSRINEMGDKVKDLTRFLSLKLDAEHETDAVKKEVSSRKNRLKKKKKEED
jgi:iron-sulfur cluster repair protein YtfE (RIC family)